MMNKPATAPQGGATTGWALDACSAGPAEEYLRRNIVIAKACGLKAEVGLTILRLRNRRRVPKWLLISIAAMQERAEGLPAELAQWRDAAPDNPYFPSADGDGGPETPLSKQSK